MISGQPETAEKAIQAGAHTLPRWSKIPLGPAARLGYADMVKVLLENGTDPNNYRSSEMTPMLFATFHGRTAALQTLLYYGAKADSFGNHLGFQPIYLAAVRGHMEVVQLLLGRGVLPQDGRDCIDAALQYVAPNGPANRVAQLLELGADARGSLSRRTPLDDTTSGVQPEVVDALRVHGADLAYRDDYKNPPLLAIRSHKRACFRYEVGEV